MWRVTRHISSSHEFLYFPKISLDEKEHWLSGSLKKTMWDFVSKWRSPGGFVFRPH